MRNNEAGVPNRRMSGRNRHSKEDLTTQENATQKILGADMEEVICPYFGKSLNAEIIDSSYQNTTAKRRMEHRNMPQTDTRRYTKG